MDLSPVIALQEKLGTNWVNINKAYEQSELKKEEIFRKTQALLPEDTSLVLFGSMGRGEITTGSDTDWALLVDGCADSSHFDSIADLKQIIENDHKPPTPGGTFGGLMSSHELVHKIGGDSDTNKNTTRRILLLLESVPIGNAEAYDRVIRMILKRYISEDWGWMHKKVCIPRFLLNDIIRYWRTITVDFAYKRRQRSGEGWGLKTIKLRMSRKLIYVSGLLACFNDELVGEEYPDDDLVHKAVSNLHSLLKYSPLEIVAKTLYSYVEIEDHTRAIFENYDKFLELIDNEDNRKHFENISPTDAVEDVRFQEIREIGHNFQEALTEIFLEENGTGICKLMKQYGVF